MRSRRRGQTHSMTTDRRDHTMGRCLSAMCALRRDERGPRARADGKHCGLLQGQPACSSHRQQEVGISTPRNGGGAAPTQSLRHPAPLPTEPRLSAPPALCSTQPCAHSTHPLSLRSISRTTPSYHEKSRHNSPGRERR